jgi:hypothetical protein
MATNAKALAAGVRALGWTVTADRLNAGLLSPERAIKDVKDSVALKRSWLSVHSFTPGTEGEAMHERITSWCERADEVLKRPEQGDEG